MRINKILFNISCLLVLVLVTSTPMLVYARNILNDENAMGYSSNNDAFIYNTKKTMIKILFDPTDPITVKAADKLSTCLKDLKVNVMMTPVSSPSGLISEMSINTWVNIYVFHGSRQGLHIDKDIIPWKNLQTILQNTPTQYHIFESCYSNTLESKLPNVSGLGESVDLEVAQLSVLLDLIEITNDNNLKDALTIVLASKFFTSLSDILVRSIFPIEPLGSNDVLTINLSSDDSLVRGPWGWLTRMLLAGWLDKSDMTGDIDWYSVSKALGFLYIDINKTQVKLGGLKAINEIKKSNLGSGDSNTGQYPFDIPLNLEITPKMGIGPWYQPEYVDLKMAITTATLDLAKTTGLDKIMQSAGYDVKLTLDPSLWGAIRLGNYVDELQGKNPVVQSNPVTFLGGGLTIKLHFEIGIPLATFLDYIIPGSGKTVSAILKLLQIKVDLLNVLDLIIGMGYNATAQSSMESVLLKVGMGFLIDAQLPSFKSLIKKAIGLDIPLGFLQLGMKLRGTAGVAAIAQFGPSGDGFKVGLFYTLMFRFWVKLFWFLNFDWENSWEDTIWLIEAISDPKTPKTDEHANLDLDSDGLWDSIEPGLGLNNKSQDTDGDGLSDGMEINEFFTDPLRKDSDGDGIPDGQEVAEFYKLNLNPIADYDGDGLHCLLDPDSDNDGLDDRQEIFGLPYDAVYNRYTKTNPALPDTDFDGLADLEEFMWTDSHRENNHTDPTKADTDGDGIKDGDEYLFYLNNPVGHDWPTIEWFDTINYLLDPDSDNDLLSDGAEKMLGTDPLDIDTDGDYDLNGNNIIDSEELLSNPDYPSYPGNLTDYGEYKGNYWPGGPFAPDGSCNEPWPIPTNPLSADSDADGITETEEWANSTKPVQFDADGDGITNDNEHNYFKTLCNDSDTDDDGLLDGDEVNFYGSSPFLTDTDNDGLSDPIEVNEQTMDILNIGLVDGIFTNVSDPDTDDDGILDGEEVYGWHWAIDRRVPAGGTSADILPCFETSEGNASLIPYYVFPDPYRARFQTNPVSADTDGDGLNDGKEKDLVLSPLTDDTDGDGLSDQMELNLMIETFGTEDIYSLPDIWHYVDYDFDGLTDRDEFFNGTEIRSPDSDSDGLTDWEEITMPVSYSQSTALRNEAGDAIIEANATGTKIYTDPLDYDSDSDGISDGDELKEYGTDPTKNDTDGDGLTDYEELFDYNTTKYIIDQTYIFHLDPTNPDSDSDGLIDSMEVEYYEGRYSQTGGDAKYAPLGDFDNDFLPNILDSDSDEDGIADGLEVLNYSSSFWPWYPVGSDPLDSDQDTNGILDGYQTDYDGDDLSDYRESMLPAPGYTQPALLSINNGKTQNYQNIINHTLFLLKDTDNDSYSDGDEIFYYYTDPLDSLSKPMIHSEIVNGYNEDYIVDIVTTSSISDFLFDSEQKQLQFTVIGEEETHGFCNVSIPTDLLNSEGRTGWTVLLDGRPIDFDFKTTESLTYIYFNYTHSSHIVTIQGTWAAEVPVASETSSNTTTTSQSSTSGFSFIVLFGSLLVTLPVLRTKKRP
ncbi:MAG: hypothetical protein ACTSW1_08950 [Candidatus Hodarchaeales archaeon]